MSKIKTRRDYRTLAIPACGGFPANDGEVVRVLGKAKDAPGYYRVRFAGETRPAGVLFHESQLREMATEGGAV